MSHRLAPCLRVLARWTIASGLLALAAATAGAEGQPGADDCILTAPDPAVSAAQQARAVFDGGTCLVAARRFEEARTWFAAYPDALAEPLWGAAVANEAGRAEAQGGNPEQARARFEQARRTGDAEVAAAASLNLARLDPRQPTLDEATAAIARVDPQRRAPLLLALGQQLQGLGLGPAGQAAALRALGEARRLARQHGAARTEVQAIDAQAQVYEDRGRHAEALRLNDSATQVAGRLGSDDLLLSLAWRRGRLMQQSGHPGPALDAYRQAADHLARIRQDIPVAYADGRSSFRTTFSPIYQNLAALLLQQPAADDSQSALRQARHALERIKQSELEDYLGDRCVADPAAAAGLRALPAGVAVLYPMVLPDRLELLVETAAGLRRLSVPVAGEILTATAQRYARALRNRGWTDTDGEILHGWLLGPVEALLGEELKTLVVVPDAALRLIPFGSLRSGERYAIEKYAIAVAPGLEFGAATARPTTGRRPNALLAGLALPGEVVGKLPAELRRSLDPGDAAGDLQADARSARLRQMLALPGVSEEIGTLQGLGLGTVLLDEDFNVAAFRRELASGRYQMVHIASHGVFGGSADTTFVMAHNDIITIDELQRMLAPTDDRDGIELLTLSACETAEGDDRAPLGLAGAALRARAQAALGSLWPVADDATKELMSMFYRELLQGRSRVEALRAAQIAMLALPSFRHPFYWAPFILVGDWN